MDRVGARILAGFLSVLHVVAIGLLVTSGVAHAAAYQKEESTYSLWAGALVFGLAYYIVREHIRFCQDIARILGDD